MSLRKRSGYQYGCVNLPQLRPGGVGRANIAVFSDTHGVTTRFERAIDMADEIAGGIHLAIHLGDCVRDTALIERRRPKLPIFRVRGNNDFSASGYPDEVLLELGQARIYFTHGHQYPASSRQMRLYYRAQELRASMALYGHTHSYFQTNVQGVDLVNPGSVALPRDGSGGSFAIVRVDGPALMAEIYTLG